MSVKGERRIPRSQLREYRERALAMRAEGLSTRRIARILGCGRSVVFGWFKVAREEGEDVLLDVKSPPGKSQLLTGPQTARLRAVLKKDPRQLEFDFALWTRRMVMDLIKRMFGVEMAERTVGDLLHRMNMSPQRPMVRASQQDPEAVRRWKEEEYPEIQGRAKAEKAKIFFCDEASVRTDYHSGTTWATTGETPVVHGTGERVSVNMISAISARGKLHFDLLDGNLDAEAFVAYLKKLLHDISGKIFLVVDRHGAHKAKIVSEFVAATDRLELFFLPAYSPDLNPDESVWKNIKHDQIGRKSVLRGKDLPGMVERALSRLAGMPQTLRGIFKSPDLLYISH